jgi:hypothetical protein
MRKMGNSLFDAAAGYSHQPSLEQRSSSMNTDTITDTDFITTIDFSQTLEQMIAAGKYDCTNPDIKADKFPIEGTGTKKFRNKVFHFVRTWLAARSIFNTERCFELLFWRSRLFLPGLALSRIRATKMAYFFLVASVAGNELPRGDT